MSAPPHLSRSAWLSRRAALRGLASIGLAAAVTSRTMRAQSEPVVEPTHGRVRRITRDGVNMFRGLPYAASTAGRHRFLPPQPVEPWAGVRDATNYGAAAPQGQAPGGPTTAWVLRTHLAERGLPVAQRVRPGWRQRGAPASDGLVSRRLVVARLRQRSGLRRRSPREVRRRRSRHRQSPPQCVPC